MLLTQLNNTFIGPTASWKRNSKINVYCGTTSVQALRRKRKIIFFGKDGLRQFLLRGNNTCFHEEKACIPEATAQFPKLKSWMRGELCFLILNNKYSGPYVLGTTRWANRGCCDQCSLLGNEVQIYYWPEPNADTSCLSIIGDDVVPWDYGATTDPEYYNGMTTKPAATYWGCTKDKLTTNIQSYFVGTSTHSSFSSARMISRKSLNSNYPNSTYHVMMTRPATWRTSHDYSVSTKTVIAKETITTAVITHQEGFAGWHLRSHGHGEKNSLSWKSYLIDPWASQPCEEPEPPTASLSSHKRSSSRGPVSVSARPIMTSGRWTNGTRVSTVVSGSYTL